MTTLRQVSSEQKDLQTKIEQSNKWQWRRRKREQSGTNSNISYDTRENNSSLRTRSHDHPMKATATTQTINHRILSEQKPPKMPQVTTNHNGCMSPNFGATPFSTTVIIFISITIVLAIELTSIRLALASSSGTSRSGDDSNYQDLSPEQQASRLSASRRTTVQQALGKFCFYLEYYHFHCHSPSQSKLMSLAIAIFQQVVLSVVSIKTG